jgi:hypothetical protein
MSFVREHFPALTEDYERRFATADFADGVYRRRMETLVRQVCRKHGLAERSTDALLTRDVGKIPLKRVVVEAPKKSPVAVRRPDEPQARLFA